MNLFVLLSLRIVFIIMWPLWALQDSVWRLKWEDHASSLTLQNGIEPSHLFLSKTTLTPDFMHSLKSIYWAPNNVYSCLRNTKMTVHEWVRRKLLIYTSKCQVSNISKPPDSSRSNFPSCGMALGHTLPMNISTLLSYVTRHERLAYSSLYSRSITNIVAALEYVFGVN